VTLLPGRYVVGLRPNNCIADPCDENADCDPADADGNPCTCKADYEGSGLDTECALKASSYTTASFDYYVKIVNTDALQFGWHVNDIGVTLQDMPGNGNINVLNTGAPGAGNYETSDYLKDFADYTSLDSVTGMVLTKNTKFYTGPIGKSHYPYATDSFSVTGATGTYTGAGAGGGAKYGNQNLGDDNSATQWWSEALNVYPESQSIEFILPGDKELIAVRVGQEVMHASSYRIEIGPVSDPNDVACGMGETQPRCAPFHIGDVYICSASSDCPKSLPFCVGGRGGSATGQCSDTKYTNGEKSESYNTEYVTGDSPTSISINTPISCGKPETQIFGEVMVFATSATDSTPKWSGVYYNDVPVMSACHCHRMCISHLEEGCKSWKFYLEANAGIKHCYLQSSIFGPGEGYYGKTEATWAGWTSGTPQYRYYKDSFPMAKQLAYDRPWLLGVTVDDATKLASGEPFKLIVSGTGLPYSKDKAKDESPLQRVKIVPSGSSCAVRVPATVSGISCVKSTRKSKLLVENPQTVYTLCGPRPTVSTASSLEYAGVSIMPSTMAMDYEVCYCEFDCFDPVRWQKVPGKLSTPASTYTWTSTPDVVTRHATDMLAPEVSVTVTRPAFGYHTLNKYWNVKLVRDYFSCDLDMDSDLFYHAATACDGPDVCTFKFQIYTGADEVGRYYVCFDEGYGHSAIPKSPTGEKFLEILEVDPDHSHPRGIFHNQYFSALAGGVATDLALSGYKIPLPSTSRVTLTTGTCGDLTSYSFGGSLMPPVVADTTAPTLVSLTIPAGGVSTSELIVMSFSERVTLEGCKGSFVLSGPEITKIPCYNATAFKDVITFSVGPFVTTPGGYNLTIETEAVLDLAGNRITYVVTGYDALTPGFTISTSETSAPTVVRTTPLPGASSPDGVVSFLFTEDIVAGDGLLSLFLCGETCATTNLVKNYHVTGDNETVSVSGNLLKIELGPAAKDFAFYKLELATGLVEDSAGNALAATYSLEFFMDSGSGTVTGFEVETSTAQVKLGASSDDPTDSKVVFDFALAASTPTGTYNLCYCNDQQDNTLAVLGDSAKTYKLQDDTVCHAKGVIDMDSDADSCVTKCSAGCVGPNCHCSGLPEAQKGALCLPKEECAARCTAETGCIGINVHDTLPICYLIDSCTAFTRPTPPTMATIPVIASSLAVTMSAADIEVLMADEDTAMQAFQTGLAADLGITVVVTAITFTRRLDDGGRELQAGLTTVNVEFYTEDLTAFSTLETLSSVGSATLAGSLQTALAASGMPVTVAAVTVAAPVYSSITVEITPRPPCDPNATYTVLDEGLANETVLDNNACLPGNDTHVIMDGEPIRLRAEGERRLWGTDAYWAAVAAAGFTNGTHAELVMASYMYFAAELGTACTQVMDFKERAGTMTVTSRVLVGIDYVVTPDIAQSLEITGPDLTYDSTDLLSKDRIMVIDCGGTCGVSGPTDKVTGYGTVAMWNDLLPHSYFQDPPWEDAQNTPIDVVTPTTPMPTPEGYSYEVTYDSSYYAGMNVDVSSVSVAVDGILRPLKDFQCYTMCGNTECTGEYCKCSGYLSGIDGPTSNALCADRLTCQYLCDQVDCQAIDMSKTSDRCYLNTLPKKTDGTIDSAASLAALMVDAAYQIVSQVPPNDESTAPGPGGGKGGPTPRRLQGGKGGKGGKGGASTPLLPPKDLGYSWSELLRFKDLTFTTGGTFKLCFCDSTLLSGTATPCLTKKDYSVEVGKVHSSGVSCLLSQPKLQRATCVEMMHGADPKPLRCYSGAAPTLTPPLLASTMIEIDAAVAADTYVPPVGTTAGSYSPEEEGVQPSPVSQNAAPAGGKGPR